MVRKVSPDAPDSHGSTGTTFEGIFYEPSEAAQALIAIQMEQLEVLQRIEDALVSLDKDRPNPHD